MTGLPKMTEVHYKGSSAAHPDLISNRITFMIDPLAASGGHIKAGTLRASRDDARAQRVLSECADRDRGRHTGVRLRELGRRVRARPNAARDRP